MIVGLTPDRPTGPTSQPARIGGLGLVLLLLCVALSSPASLAASRPSALVKIAGTPGEFEGLQDVACPSVTQCTAVGGSVEATFNPRRPGHPLATRIADGGRLETVACPLATQCTTLVAHDRELTFNPRTPAGAVSVALGGRDFSADTIACPSATQCTAFGTGSVACPPTRQCDSGPAGIPLTATSDEVTFDPLSPGTPTATVLTPDDNFVSDQSAIACPTLSQCTAVIEGGQHHAQLTFNPLKPTSPILGPIHTPGSELDIDYDGAWIACPSAQECVAVFGTPDESVFDPQVRRTASLVRVVPGTQELLAIACPSSSRCVAVGRGQNEMGDVGPEAVFAPSLPNDAVTTRLAPSTGLQAVACPSATQCTAVDYTGAEITFAPLIPRHG